MYKIYEEFTETQITLYWEAKNVSKYTKWWLIYILSPIICITILQSYSIGWHKHYYIQAQFEILLQNIAQC